ncbi:TIGR03564 family F420-dependent LLM class oxidoreductase [Amycolatopsis sp. FDAARGOS 1241]|uniref:TIGR03564 family F420-dependent LLM class oxidoreductase n=1 Tax=Amycolatopsis sp. FDAARGOS 1241 TaxID=2778070 RepID=UPI00194DB248|nr:TIGR03564 family F420-dependent LLM class oxidoreductase [Amycolatopsis sp. FDAARGOS 1241]QRP45199.1 TIGR03564 family F420-dependent LLM class oxidoreductase [Amycolatopsis sp. FDAARGOS 1241]
MQIGIAIGDLRGPAGAAELLHQAREAAAAGFATAWVSQGFGWDAMVALAAVGHVEGLRFGTAVVPVPQRHPLVLAGQALSVQAVTGNRLTLGVGAGIGAMVGPVFGLATDRPARRMREYLTLLNPLLRGESVVHQGETLTAVGSVAVPGARAPSVVVAALGPAMLRVARELADGTVTWLTGPRTLAGHIVPRLGDGKRVIAGLPVCVTADEAGVRARIAETFAMAAIANEYRAGFDREGVAGAGDVAVVGDEDAVAGQLKRLHDAGVTEFWAAPYGSVAEQERTSRVLAEIA